KSFAGGPGASGAVRLLTPFPRARRPGELQGARSVRVLWSPALAGRAEKKEVILRNPAKGPWGINKAPDRTGTAYPACRPRHAIGRRGFTKENTCSTRKAYRWSGAE